ncbi:MAG: RNA methyltransferase [Ruminococcaceae bacterium]|nr:RNA methyltransferase [Oscillospiraceae bacterium]
MQRIFLRRKVVLEKIISVQNPKIKQFSKLVSSSKERKKTGTFAIEGARLCFDAAKSGVEILELFYTSQAYEKFTEEIDYISSVAEAVYEVSTEIAEKLRDTESTQGVFARCRNTENETTLSSFLPDGKYVVLENLQDPSNLGAVARTAEALGIKGAVLVSCCDVFNPKAQRASMGSLFRLPFARISDIDELFSFSEDKNIKTVATVVDSSAEKINKADLSGGVFLIIGNEGNGIQQTTADRCTMKVTIPMQGRAESLNASMAACIAMWEVLR